MALTTPRLGLQLFSLRDEFAKNPFATIQQVAEVGFEGVEFVGHSLRSIDQDRLMGVLREHKLSVAGIAFEIEEFETDLDAIIRLCRSLHCPTVVLPSFGKRDCRSSTTLKAAALRMNYVASRCKSEGIAFLYHTHGLELTHVDEKRAIEWLSEFWDAHLIGLEIDTYWVDRAGVDVLSFVKDYGRWCKTIHFKDMKDRVTGRDTEVGTGIIDITGVVAEGIEQNVEWFVVEQEEFDVAPLESIKISFRNLSQMLQEALAA